MDLSIKLGCVVKYFQRNSRGNLETVWVLFETEEIGIKNETTCTCTHAVSVKDLYNVKMNNGHQEKQLLENLV